MRFDEQEPVFKRSKWGTSRYVYNSRNPLGFALIVLTVVLVAVMLLLMHKRAGPLAPPSDHSPTPWSPSEDTSWQVPPAPESP